SAVSLAGIVDMQRAFELHLSNDAVVEFLGGKPEEVSDHYHEADPMKLSPGKANLVLIHGTKDDIVPVSFSRNYVQTKSSGNVNLIEIAGADHFDLIDPRSAAWKQVE